MFSEKNTAYQHAVEILILYTLLFFKVFKYLLNAWLCEIVSEQSVYTIYDLQLTEHWKGKGIKVKFILF